LWFWLAEAAEPGAGWAHLSFKETYYGGGLLGGGDSYPMPPIVGVLAAMQELKTEIERSTVCRCWFAQWNFISRPL